MHTVVTINSQFGAGGHEVGKRLAYTMHSTYYDKNLVHKVAHETGLHPDFIERYEEMPMARQYVLGMGMLFTVPRLTPQENLQIAQANIIKNIGKSESCVIMGRCANYLLYETAFKVFIYSSDKEARIKRYQEAYENSQKMAPKQLWKYMKKMDKQRAKYYRDYAGEKWQEMEQYNLCIDTAEIDIKRCVEVIRKAIL